MKIYSEYLFAGDEFNGFVVQDDGWCGIVQLYDDYPQELWSWGCNTPEKAISAAVKGLKQGGYIE